MVGVRELTLSRVRRSPTVEHVRERLAALDARRSGAWRKEMRWVVESEAVARRRRLVDDCNHRRCFDLHARRRECGRRGGFHARVDARAMVVMLLSGMRVRRRAMRGMMAAGVVSRLL